MHKALLALLLFAAPLFAAALVPAAGLDVKRMAGLWYEVARIPNRFQEGAVAVTADIHVNNDLTAEVKKEWRAGGDLDGELVTYKADVYAPNENEIAKLKISFFSFVWHDFWVIDFHPNYDYVVISEPTRANLWIYSKSREIAKEEYDKILERLKGKEIDVAKIQRTLQRK